MNKLNKFAVLAAFLSLSASFAYADAIDLSGPGSVSGTQYTPGASNPPFSVYSVTLATGEFATFAGATPVFYPFNYASDPTTALFSVENLAGTLNLTFNSFSENVLNATQIVFTGELYENGTALTAASMGFSENPLNTSNTEDSITIAAAPEPSSLILIGSGLLGGAALLFRKRENAAA